MKLINIRPGTVLIKDGRRKLAKVINMEIRYNKVFQYPFFVEVPKFGGGFNCLDKLEVREILQKYLNIEIDLKQI